jgi:hypothetical protein
VQATGFGGSPARLIGREPGTRRLVFGRNAGHRSAVSKSPVGGATDQSVVSSESCRRVKATPDGEQARAEPGVSRRRPWDSSTGSRKHQRGESNRYYEQLISPLILLANLISNILGYCLLVIDGQPTLTKEMI